MDKHKPTKSAPAQIADAGRSMEADRERVAASVDPRDELTAALTEELASIGIDVNALSRSQQMRALAGYLQVQTIRNLPELAPGQVGPYIVAINRAMADGAIPPSTGKIMLYGAQLYLAAEPRRSPDEPTSAEIEVTRAIVHQIDATSGDRRHRKQ